MVTNIAGVAPKKGSEPAAGRCPHQVFRDVLGPELVAALLYYVTERKHDFKPATIVSTDCRRKRIDRGRRDSYRLTDLGPFKAPLCSRLERACAEALHRLGLFEPDLEAREFEINAYRDGGHFAPHIDTLERLDAVRIVSCVYYFAGMPRGFSGGELRLFGFPTATASPGPRPPTVDIVPETDSLVVFPSWLRHEVLPVHVPSGTWADARFTINCWVYRVNRPMPAGSAAG